MQSITLNFTLKNPSFPDSEGVSLTGIVDTGSTTLYLPESKIKELLPVPIQAIRTVRYADGRLAEVKIIALRFEAMNRFHTVDVLVTQNGGNILIGHQVLQLLGLNIDNINHKVYYDDNLPYDTYFAM